MDSRAPRVGMEIRGEQQMLLLPRMLQSIEVLQLSAPELEGWLQEALQSNEALELVEVPAESEGERRGNRERSEAHDEMLRNHPARPRALPEIIEEQLASVELKDDLFDWVRFLVACIDESGYLSASDEQLLALAGERGLTGGVSCLGQAIGALQALEPRGIGARDAVEALLLQLDTDDPDYALLCQLLEEYLEELARNKLPRVAKALDLEMEELQRLLGVLRGLDPRPLRHLAEDGAPRIEPEIEVEWTSQGHELRLARSNLPSVAVSDVVLEVASQPEQSAETRRYLRGRIDQARWVVQALEQRQTTILRVASAVFSRQQAFLSQGPGHLQPLRMGEIADALGIHLSTVSRAAAGKYAQTPWGIFPLRSFFQAASGGDAQEGSRLARDDLRERVRAIIEGEDTREPLSDDEVVGVLASEGLSLARRTVAKYRRELGIPSSYRRRKYE